MSVVSCRLHVPALAALVLTAAAQADVQTIETRVVHVTGDVATLDKGSEDGVAAGQVFDVFRDGEVYFLPLTNGKVPLIRPQERVGRVEVFELDDHTARARVIEGRAAPNEFAYLNPKAQAPNHPPEFVDVDPNVRSVAWRESVEISLRNTNERDEPVQYRWSTNGGVLAAEVTSVPVNRWIAPPKAGDYQVQVTATDAAGQSGHAAVLVASGGIPSDFTVRGLRPSGRRFSGASLYPGEVKDVAFCGAGNTRRYVLTERSLFLDEVLGQQRVSQLPDGEFSSLAVYHPQEGEGRIYLLDSEQRSVLAFRAPDTAQQPPLSGKPVRIGQSGDEGNGYLTQPVDMALSPDGELIYVLDAGQRCVQVFRNDGRFLLSFGQPGRGPNELRAPSAIAVGRDGRVFVADSDPDRRAIVVFEGFLALRELPLQNASGKVVGLTVDAIDGSIYAADRASGRVFAFDGQSFEARATYAPASGLCGALRNPLRMRSDRVGRLCVVDRDGRSVVDLAPSAKNSQWFERRTGGVDVGDLLRVAAGPRGEVAVLDDSQRVTSFDAEGWVVAQFGGSGDGKGKFDSATDLAISAQGEVFVLDSGRQLLNRFTRTGVAYTPKLTGIRQAVDLSPISDRSGLAVLTQGGNDAFILVDDQGQKIFGGQQYEGELTPPRGCVTKDASSKGYVFWTANTDEEKVFRAPMDRSPVELGHDFNTAVFGDVIGDMEPTVYGWVFASDRDAEKLVAFFGDGRRALELTFGDQLRGLSDLASDDLGNLYAIDTAKNAVVELTPQR